MIEVGDMILYTDNNDVCDNDIGWVVHTEKHLREDGSANLIYIKWLLEDSTDLVWQHNIDVHKEFTIIKGGQHAK